MEVLEAALISVVKGDVAQLSTVLAARHSDLREAAANLAQLWVSRPALTRVLVEWRNGRCTAAEVQQWASFIQRGYNLENLIEPLIPIDIEYDDVDEDLIIEIVARLEEIGDIVDGTIDAIEQEEMLKNLGS